MIASVALATAALILPGCAGTEVREGAAAGQQVRDERAPNARIRYNQAVILSDGLQVKDTKKYNWPISWFKPTPEQGNVGRIAVEEQGTRRLPMGNLQVNVVIRNRDNDDVIVQARSQFFDSQKFPVEAPTAWRNLNIPANGVLTYQENSLKSENIEYYYVEIREQK